jgi:hypothetical protein
VKLLLYISSLQVGNTKEGNYELMKIHGDTYLGYLTTVVQSQKYWLLSDQVVQQTDEKYHPSLEVLYL